MARIVYHVVHKNADDGWHLEENARSIARFKTKDEAIDAGRKKGNNLHVGRKDAQLLIHREDGSIETEYTYGHDPRRTPG